MGTAGGADNGHAISKASASGSGTQQRDEPARRVGPLKSAEYQVPIRADDNVYVVPFVDSGTVARAQPAEKDLAIAEFYRRIGHVRSARFYYELVCRRYPDTVAAKMAAERLRELRKQAELPEATGQLIVSLNGRAILKEEVRSPASYSRLFDDWLAVLSTFFEVTYANRYDGRIEVREQAKEAPKKVEGARYRVNGVPIHDEDVRAAYLAREGALDLAPAELARRIAKARNATLRHLVEREVVLQDASARLHDRARLLRQLGATIGKEFDKRWLPAALKSTGLANEDKLRAFLCLRDTSLEAVRRQWQRDFLAREYLRARIQPVLDKSKGPRDEVVQRETKRFIAELFRKATIERLPNP
jgi:hypothetical protein